MNAKMRINPAVGRAYDVTCTSSNTLQCGAPGHVDPTRAELIETAVRALGGASDLRLDQSRARL